ncbi:MAG: hypothetical protein ABWY66_15860, partial [Xanthobacteraceae bacterium]
MSEARAFAYREKASQAHDKAMRAGIPETTRRAWLIVERDWTRMAEREAAKLDDAVSRHPWTDDAARSSGRQAAMRQKACTHELRL